MHTATAVVTITAMLALVPAGLTAAAAGLSIGAMAGGIYSLALMRRATGVALRSMAREIVAPAVAAVLAALAVLPLEAFVVDAESHGTAAGAGLLVAEALAGLAVYLGLLAALAPSLIGELSQGAGVLWRRLARFRGPDPTTPEPELLDETLAP
jgi:hypothetical protein